MPSAPETSRTPSGLTLAGAALLFSIPIFSIFSIFSIAMLAFSIATLAVPARAESLAAEIGGQNRMICACV